MQIYVGKGGQQLGPFPIEEINRKLADGTFSGTDLAWYEGAVGWAALSTISGVALPVAAPAAAPAPTPVPTPVAPAAVPVRSTTPIARTPVPASSYKTLAIISWVLLGLTALVSLIPFVGCGVWFLGWAVAVAAIIMGIIVITRGGTAQGIMIIVGGVLIVPLAIGGQVASLAIFGAVLGKEDRQHQTQIMENLRTIDTAKGQWVTATKAKDKAPVTMANLTSYLSGKEVKPVVGEQYDPSPVGHPPTATLPSDKSLGSFKKGEVLTAASLEEALAKSSYVSFYSYKNSPAPTATANPSPASTTGGKPSASPKTSVAPKPSETVSPAPSSSVRPSPSARFGQDDESTVTPRPRTTPAETPSSKPSPSAKFAPSDGTTNSPRPRTSATVESSGLKQGKQNPPGASPSASPEDDDD